MSCLSLRLSNAHTLSGTKTMKLSGAHILPTSKTTNAYLLMSIPSFQCHHTVPILSHGFKNCFLVDMDTSIPDSTIGTKITLALSLLLYPASTCTLVQLIHYYSASLNLEGMSTFTLHSQAICDYPLAPTHHL